MRTLELRPEFETQPSRRNVAIIEAEMLFPHDATARKRLIAAGLITAAAKLSNVLPAAQANELRAAALDLAPETPRVGDLEAEGLSNGWLVGEVLRRAVGIHMQGKRPGLTDIVNAICGEGMKDTDNGDRAHGGELAKYRTSALANKYGKKQLALGAPRKSQFWNKIWPSYRSAAHLWAAYLEDVSVWPCAPSRVPSFVALAEFYRVQGEAAGVLNPGDSLLMPTMVNPPEVTMAVPHDSTVR